MGYKKVLIISPYFPPSNTADMQRVRMSLPYFNHFGWDAEVVSVDPVHSYAVKDPLLIQSIPEKTRIHYVGALPARLTRKFGLGSLALRSFWFYRKKVNKLLKKNKYDLIYFSTTEFTICALGPYWKKKHGVPYVIDMQDPWYTGYHDDIPKNKLPPKFWFSDRLNRLLEPMAMNKVDGLISVSEKYLEALRKRYPRCKVIPQQTITFGWLEKDLKIAIENRKTFPAILSSEGKKLNIVYVGRGGADMDTALNLFFHALRKCAEEEVSWLDRFHFYFIGTSYASSGEGIPSMKPIAESLGFGNMVTEITDRVPFYQAMNILANADALLVPGSNDPQYTASKIFPYAMSGKPLLAVFHPESSVIPILQSLDVGTIVTFEEDECILIRSIKNFLNGLILGQTLRTEPDPVEFEKFSARSMTEKQCQLFNQILA